MKKRTSVGSYITSFSHKRLESEEEINKFINQNEPFIEEIYKKFGKTNLDDYYINHLKSKKGSNLNAEYKTTLPSGVNQLPSFGTPVFPVFFQNNQSGESFNPCFMQFPIVPFHFNPNAPMIANINPFANPLNQQIVSDLGVNNMTQPDNRKSKDPRLNKFKR